MANVTVYRFEMYDVQTDQMRTSVRWGTLDAIERIRGHALIRTAIEIDERYLGGELEGMTMRNFNPDSQIEGGFQREVKRGY